MAELIIRGGTVVTPFSTQRMDVGIIEDKIAWLAAHNEVPNVRAAEELDATGKIVTPGGVEAHAHIFEPMYKGWSGGEDVWLQSPESASRAALFGGTTSVCSFAFMDVHTKQVEFDANQAVEHRKKVFGGHSFTDFAFHPVVTGTPSRRTIESIREVIQDGSPSIKIFTTNVTADQKGIKIPNGPLYEVLEAVSDANGILMAHAEDDELIAYREILLTGTASDDYRNFGMVHTNLGEKIAFNSLITLSSELACPLYFAHVTGVGGIEAIAEARLKGLPVYAETLHDLCCFNANDYHKPNGLIYHLGTGLRTKSDNAALWRALQQGLINVMATDEYTTSLEIKLRGDTIKTATGGHAGIETRGPIAFSEGYMKGRISLQRFVEIFSTNPAKVLGMFPQKGVIQPGSDADLVIWDPDYKGQITMENLHHDSDYSPWEGWNLQGRPEITILRGKVVVSGDSFYGNPEDGRFIKRRIERDVLEGKVH